MTALATAATATPEAHELRRVYFLTDMQSVGRDEEAVIREAQLRAAQSLHTTVIGMGVDLSVGTVERLSSIHGGKYGSVANTNEFVRSIGTEFSHDVTPIAFDIKVQMGGGWAIERACGSAELNSLSLGAIAFTISSEFASPLDTAGQALGGVMLFKLTPPSSSPAGTEAVAPSTPAGSARRSARLAATQSSPMTNSTEAATAEQLELHFSWKALQGPGGTMTTTLAMPRTAAAAAFVTTDAPPPTLRKALALVRFCDLQAGFCEAEDSDALAMRMTRLAQCRAGRATLIAELAAVGDCTLQGSNANILQTLDQIITLEERETAELQLVEEQVAALAATQAAPPDGAVGERQTRASKRSLDGGSGGTAPGGRSSRQRPSAEPPASYLCSITGQLMTDPVCTSDGHTFERAAIQRWLSQRGTSPLTGLRLVSKALLPNHMLRSLIDDWKGV